MHTHNFTTYLLVRTGTFILVTEEGPTTHQAGKTSQLNSGIVHAEQACPEGAVFLVGKK
jgi:quercetin dioxygenase-like cupin family protein